MNWNDPVRRWFEYHRDDYQAVQQRLAACRNVMYHGRREAAIDMLKQSCVHAVLSIQTERDRHERAFTAYYAGDTSLETACGMTVYGNQKADWLHDAFANFDYGAVVDALRTDGHDEALAVLAADHTGLSWTKGAFALAMCGVWELACPDSRTKDVIGYEGRIRTHDDYDEACQMIDERLSADVPLFIKQWVMYDSFAGEHARHMPFFREVLSYA